jgi:hypothetical protein
MLQEHVLLVKKAIPYPGTLVFATPRTDSIWTLTVSAIIVLQTVLHVIAMETFTTSLLDNVWAVNQLSQPQVINCKSIMHPVAMHGGGGQSAPATNIRPTLPQANLHNTTTTSQIFPT